MKKLLIFFVIFFGFNIMLCSAAYYTVSMVEPIENISLKYNDENVFITFILPPKNPEKLFISLYNKTDETMEIDWSNVMLIFRGKAYSILTETQLLTRLNSMKSVVMIPPKTRHEESIYVERNLEYVEQPAIFSGGLGTYRSGWGGWIHVDDIFSSNNTVRLNMKPFFPKDVNDRFLGYEFGLFLPVGVQSRKDYSFTFKIDNISLDISPGFLGVLVVDKEELLATNDKEYIKSGVLITSVAKKGAGRKGGLMVGDNIIAINDMSIDNIEDFTSSLKYKQEKDVVKVNYVRDGKEYSVNIKLGKY